MTLGGSNPFFAPFNFFDRQKLKQKNKPKNLNFNRFLLKKLKNNLFFSQKRCKEVQ